MTCPDNQQLHRYHDEQLTTEQAAAVESHLRQCERCRTELRALRRMSDMLFHAHMAAPNEQAMRRWAGSARQIRDSRIRHLAEWMMAAAAAVVLGIFGLWPNMETAQADSLLGNVERVMLADSADESLPANLATARLFAADLSGESSNHGSDDQ
ncbi:MAG: anti-sigma factor family protein [Phycisphaerales bacterium]